MSIERLVQAVQTLNADDAMRLHFEPAQWALFAPSLECRNLRPGDVLILFRATDRAAYLLESGTLQVFVPDSTPVRRPVAILRPGALVGEPSLFSDAPRMAQVEAMSPSVVWCLTRPAFDEFTQRHPELGMAFLRAAGGVLADRMRANLERGLPVA